MSWDLILRRQLPRDCSRGAPGPALPSLPEVLAVGAAVLLPLALRRAEICRFRRAFGTDLQGRSLHETAEMPAVSIRELIYKEEQS